MEEEGFSASILRYSTSEHMKVTIMKKVNLNMENRKKMVLSNRAWPEMVKMAFEKTNRQSWLQGMVGKC